MGSRRGRIQRRGTVTRLNETVLRQLFAAPPPDFVAARNELVKGLRKEKRRDEATALAALRRPGWDEWSLNAVAASSSDVVAGFADAAAQVRDAQAAAIEGRDGPDIRTALRDLRDRSAELVRLADAVLGDAGRQPVPGEINARLSQVAASDVAVAQLRAGVLGSGDAAPDDLFGDLEPAPATAKAAAPRSKTTKHQAAPAASAVSRRMAETSQVQRDAAAERAARAEAAKRKEALVEANRLHAAAVKARHRAAAALEKATAAVERARAALAESEAEHAGAQRELDESAAVEQAAADEVDTARAVIES
jgi:hypothetical protein